LAVIRKVMRSGCINLGETLKSKIATTLERTIEDSEENKQPSLPNSTVITI